MADNKNKHVYDHTLESCEHFFVRFFILFEFKEVRNVSIIGATPQKYPKIPEQTSRARKNRFIGGSVAARTDINGEKFVGICCRYRFRLVAKAFQRKTAWSGFFEKCSCGNRGMCKSANK